MSGPAAAGPDNLAPLPLPALAALEGLSDCEDHLGPFNLQPGRAGAGPAAARGKGLTEGADAVFKGFSAKPPWALGLAWMTPDTPRVPGRSLSPVRGRFGPVRRAVLTVSDIQRAAGIG